MGKLMDEYIRRGDAVFAIHDSNMMNPIDQIEGWNAILMVPAADVAPVRHGVWMWVKDHWECSVCRGPRFHDLALGVDASYCGRCGAKMDKEG